MSKNRNTVAVHSFCTPLHISNDTFIPLQPTLGCHHFPCVCGLVLLNTPKLAITHFGRLIGCLPSGTLSKWFHPRHMLNHNSIKIRSYCCSGFLIFQLGCQIHTHAPIEYIYIYIYLEFLATKASFYLKISNQLFTILSRALVCKTVIVLQKSPFWLQLSLPHLCDIGCREA